jgi:hypothetical protein
MERAMVAEARGVELQRLGFDEPADRHEVEHQMREIRLSRHRADRGEFRDREAHQIIGTSLGIGHAIELRLFRRVGPFHRAAELQGR